MTKGIIEKLAELEHEQWMFWSKSLISQILDDVNPYDVTEIRNRILKKHQSWLKLWKPYDELTEEEKEQDRIWARKVLEETAKEIFEMIKKFPERGLFYLIDKRMLEIQEKEFLK